MLYYQATHETFYEKQNWWPLSTHISLLIMNGAPSCCYCRSSLHSTNYIARSLIVQYSLLWETFERYARESFSDSKRHPWYARMCAPTNVQETTELGNILESTITLEGHPHSDLPFQKLWFMSYLCLHSESRRVVIAASWNASVARIIVTEIRRLVSLRIEELHIRSLQSLYWK